MADVNPSGVATLTRQLKAANTAVERNLSAGSELLEAVEGLQEALEQGFEDLQSEIEVLKGTCESEGGSAVTATEGLGEAGSLVAEDRLPSSSASLGEALAAAKSSHDESGDRLQSMTEGLERDGFQAMEASLGAVREENSGSESQMAASFTELEGSRGEALEVVAAAESETVEALDGAQSTLSGDLQPELESVASGRAGELQSAAAANQQAVEQIDTGVRRAYDAWVVAAEGARDAMLEALIGELENLVQSLAQGQDTQLEAPCDRLLNESASSTQAELETISNEYDDWASEAEELAATVSELERAESAKNRFDQHIESAG